MWHRWFAWRPIVMKIEGELDHWVWFEYVQRKWSHSRYGDKSYWKYRPIGAKRVRDTADYNGKFRAESYSRLPLPKDHFDKNP
jgi:hypothetical protein